MTIAACYVSHEGVVLGADSTSTYFLADETVLHHEYAQKILEIGEGGSTLGMATWGLMGLPEKSYRQIAAELSDELLNSKPRSVQEVAQRLIDRLWPEYTRQLSEPLKEFRRLNDIAARTKDEQAQWVRNFHRSFSGICMGGHVEADRTPHAFEIQLKPAETAAPMPIEISPNLPRFWGMPNMMERLLNGIDPLVYHNIRTSPLWKGAVKDLDDLIVPHELNANLQLPLREAIDWIFSSIFITIKAMKFYKSHPYCGGPIEVAAITADRCFRWVRHKGLDHAINEHDPKEA